MRKKIIFQKCNFNNIFFLFYTIASFIDIYFESKVCLEESETDDSETKYLLPRQIINYLYISNLSDFLAIIPHFIRKRLVKKKEENIVDEKSEENSDENSNHSNLIYHDYEKSITKKKEIILYCAFVIILDFFEKFAFILYNIIYPKKSFYTYTFGCIVPFEIIFQFVCSYIILKIHFYKLQYFSLFLNLGIFIILLIIDLINIIKNGEFEGITYCFYGLNIISYSFEYSLGKKIILYGFISVYSLIVLKGLIVFIIIIIFSIIFFSVKKDTGIVIISLLKNPQYIPFVIGKIFTYFFANLFSWLIVDRFSPNYLPFAFLTTEFGYFLVDLIDGIEIKWDLYLRLILYLVSAICVIIHNEIVVINICNLGSDTKYFLDLKVQSEELFANTDNPEIMKRYDSFTEMDEVNENSDEDKTEN